jgi:hypothetical protein
MPIPCDAALGVGWLPLGEDAQHITSEGEAALKVEGLDNESTIPVSSRKTKKGSVQGSHLCPVRPSD